MQLDVIARIKSAYPTKFGVPRQPGLVDALEARVVFEPAYRNADALRGIEGFDCLWLIWGFSHNLRGGEGEACENAASAWSPTVRPPRLDGTRRMGVFATRSSFRPNGLGLSCVRLVGVDLDGADAPTLRVTGADMVDGTPIYDVKPYLPRFDSHPDARAGWVEEAAWPEIERVEIPPAELAKVPEDLREPLVQLLRQDPRPAYTRTGQEGREFWVPLGDVVAYFVVDAGEASKPLHRTLRVTHVVRLNDDQLDRLRRTGTV